MEGQGKKKNKGGKKQQHPEDDAGRGQGKGKAQHTQQPQVNVGGSDMQQQQPGQGKGASKQKQQLDAQQQQSQQQESQQQESQQQQHSEAGEKQTGPGKLTYKQKRQLAAQQQQSQQQESQQQQSQQQESQQQESQQQESQQQQHSEAGEKQTGPGKLTYKQKRQLAAQQQQSQQQESQQQESQQQESQRQESQQHSEAGEKQTGPGKLTYKQKKQLAAQQQQSQQQESGHQKPQQQQQSQQHSETGEKQTGQRKLTYKEKQELRQQQQPSKPAEVHDPSPTHSTDSANSKSSSHAAAIERIEDDFQRIKIDKQKIHSSGLLAVLMRPNMHGTRGKPIKLEVNYVQLLLDRIISTAYHYDVDVKPPASRKWQRLAFAEFTKQLFPNHGFAYDGHKNAYTARRLKTDHYEQEVKVRSDGRDRKFTIAMKEAAVLDMNCLKTYMKNGSNYEKPMSAIQCLDIVLRTAYENNPRFVKFKKSIYVIPDRPEDIGANHELWYGLFQSALLGSKPFLNIDVSHKAFPSGGPILKILSEFNRQQLPDRVPDWMATELHGYLKGMEISYTGPDGVEKVFKYNGIKGPANQQKFKLENGTEMTIEQYFRQQKRPLRYPNLPVIHVGSTIRNVMLPIELCSVPRGQALTKKHPDSCTQHIIKRSATDTATRKSKIMSLFNQIGYNNAPAIKEFGVSVGIAFENVDGRIIDPPELIYKNQKRAQPMRGVWRADNCNFIVPSTDVHRRALSWTILNLDGRTRPDAIEEFGRAIYQMSQKQGVQLQPFSMRDNFYEPNDMRTCIRDLDNIFNDLKRRNMDLVFVVIPNPGRDGDVYAKVKQKAELQVGVLTQCIKSFTLDRKRGDMSTISNIWLKINAKTNGSNHLLAPNCKPPMSRKAVMYIGADVTHPSPEQTNIPSVVGVAASYDLEGFRYNCCYRLQNAKDEMIRDLENIVCKQLKQFHQQNKILPELIMYYRDGVSEGQFSEILTIELRAIQSAAATVSANQQYKPKITFIVVQKRHHARFFPTAKCPTEGKNNNLPPGTIVDRYITAPNQYQFFLVSHAAVQGVAKPTKYCVLYDDENCHPDQLQAVTYNLCHMFARCNRSVSYPAPTYYAHLAAYRGRVYIKDRNLNMDNLLNEYKRMQIKTEIIDGHPMFFV